MLYTGNTPLRAIARSYERKGRTAERDAERAERWRQGRDVAKDTESDGSGDDGVVDCQDQGWENCKE